MKDEALSLLIVDDEPLAIRRMENLCQRLSIDCRTDIAGGGEAAMDAMASTRYDALLLDIDMPGKSGIEVANALLLLPHQPQVIFTTAHKDFAVEAFRLNAADYLLKPVKLEYLGEALKRVKERIYASPEEPDPQGDKRLWVQGHRSAVQIRLDDIMRVEAEGDYMRIISAQGNFMLHMPMHKIEQLLPEQNFVRIHRSTMIRRDMIRQTRREGRQYLVMLDNGERLTVGPSYLDNIGATLAS